MRGRLVKKTTLQWVSITQSISWEVLLLKVSNLIHLFKPPCPQCPYTLGEVRFVVSPCPQCKLNNYQMYHQLKNGKSMSHKCKNPNPIL